MQKKRKKVFFAAAIILAVLFATLPSRAEDIYFTAVNNMLMELRSETMPVMHNSVPYVPWSVFNSKELGTYAMYSKESQMVVVSDGEKMLYFDMSTGTVTDENDESYFFSAIYTNNTAYIPAYYVADFFGINYSYICNDYGHIIRVSRDGYLSDEDFSYGAELLMQSRLKNYQQKEIAAQESHRPAPTPVPTATPSPSPPPGSIADHSGVTVYIAYLGVTDNTEDILDILERYSCKACFFATAEQITERPDTIRRIQADGHSLGVLFENDLAEEYEAASAALKAAALCKTFITASADPLSYQQREALGETRLRVWSGGVRAATRYAAIQAAQSASERCCILLDGDADFSSQLLYSLINSRYELKRITEVTVPAE